MSYNKGLHPFLCLDQDRFLLYSANRDPSQYEDSPLSETHLTVITRSGRKKVCIYDDTQFRRSLRRIQYRLVITIWISNIIYFQSHYLICYVVSISLQITPNEFIDFQQSLKVDILESPSLDVPHYITSKKRRKSVDISLKWLDKCIQLQSEELRKGNNKVIIGISINVHFEKTCVFIWIINHFIYVSNIPSLLISLGLSKEEAILN